MDIHLLKTLAAVAREGSVTRAAELLCLSQPAVSAHIKAMEETLEVALFERTPRGMRLTGEGARLLEKAEEALRAHRAVIDEAARLKGRVAGRLRLGAGVGVGAEVLGRFMLRLAERFDEAEAALRHGPSREIVRKIKSGAIDAGFHMEMFGGEEELTSLEIGRFAIFAVVAPELAVERQAPVDWAALSGLPWIYPSVDTCCGCAAEQLFEVVGVRPKRIIQVDRGDVTRRLVASGAGVGLLHEEAAKEAEAAGELKLIDVIAEARVFFSYPPDRAKDPLVAAAASVAADIRREA